MNITNAQAIFNNTIGLRSKVLKEDHKNDPQAFKLWLESEIDILGKTQEPTTGTVETLERYVAYWQACKMIVDERDRQLQNRKNRIQNILKDFEAMKNAK